MPELPEVEHARIRLTRHTAGRTVTAVELADPAVFRTRLSTTVKDAHPDAPAIADQLVGTVVAPPVRIGKRLGWRIGDVAFLVHLGMTGRWIQRDEAPRHGRLALALSDGQRWWFEDSRRWGCLVPVPDLGAAMADGLGPDALEAPLDGPGLAQAMRGRRSIKVALMDQSRVAGIGNIQAAEALWKARIHPTTRADAIDADGYVRLAEAMLWTLRRTLADAGDGELVYVSQDADLNPFLVYGRVGEPCTVCGTPIRTLKLGGRTSPFCPGCQPDPAPMG